MTYVLASALAAAVIAIVILSIKLASSLADQRSLVSTALESGKHQLEAERMLADVTRDRNDALARKVEAELAAAKATRYALACEAALRESLKDDAQAAVDKVRAATSISDASASLSDLVSAPLPGEAGPVGDSAAGTTAEADRG